MNDNILHLGNKGDGCSSDPLLILPITNKTNENKIKKIS